MSFFVFLFNKFEAVLFFCMTLWLITFQCYAGGIELRFNKEKSSNTLFVELWNEEGIFLGEQEIDGFDAAYLAVKGYLKKDKPHIDFVVITAGKLVFPNIRLWVIRRQEDGLLGLCEYNHDVNSVKPITKENYLRAKLPRVKDLRLKIIERFKNNIKYFLSTEEKPKEEKKTNKSFIHLYIAIDSWVRS